MCSIKKDSRLPEFQGEVCNMYGRTDVVTSTPAGPIVRKQPWRSTKSIASKASVWSGVLWSIFPLQILDKENPTFQGVSRQSSFHGTNAMCNFKVFGMMCQHRHVQYIVFFFPFPSCENYTSCCPTFSSDISSATPYLFNCLLSVALAVQCPKTRVWHQITSSWKLRRHWTFCDGVYPSAFH